MSTARKRIEQSLEALSHMQFSNQHCPGYKITGVDIIQLGHVEQWLAEALLLMQAPPPQPKQPAQRKPCCGQPMGVPCACVKYPPKPVMRADAVHAEAAAMLSQVRADIAFQQQFALDFGGEG